MAALAGGLLLAAAWPGPASAQAPGSAANAAAEPPAAPAPAASAAAVPEAAASSPQRVEITGRRLDETEQRRRSTASKIIIGRDEIEAYGDEHIGEVLRRLPGVTTPGRPGRGGPPRLRGLGNGYTQILIDGEPPPRGFSLEQLTPDQVERIEILRAPTAETGARAVAGTINIVLREGQQPRANDLRAGIGVEQGRVSPGAFWSRNEPGGQPGVNLSLALFQRRSSDTAQVREVERERDSGRLLASSVEDVDTLNDRLGLSLSSRLQWRLRAAGDGLTLTPSLYLAKTDGHTARRLSADPGPATYAAATEDRAGQQASARLAGQWKQRLDDALRLELSGTAGLWRSSAEALRLDIDDAGLPLRRVDDRGRNREHSLSLKAKLQGLLGDGDDAPLRPGTPAPVTHDLVVGGELEWRRRHDQRTLLYDGEPALTEFGDNLDAEVLRLAAYAQDEWNPNRHWGLHAGLRWEGIQTWGDDGAGGHPQQLAAVWTPLAHAVWKPDPGSRSQWRLSLTRSWRAPATGQLIARPSPNSRDPLDQTNDPAYPDRAGNPDLRPELATGIDLAFEHYPPGGGLLSASLFHRRIRDLIREVVDLETVSWSDQPRYVSRPRNVGSATAQGLELEAKGRLDQWRTDAPRLELRANLAFYRSRVDSLPGPDNRLDGQADASANLGADWRWPGRRLKLGGSLSWVPGYATQVDATRLTRISTRRVWDAYLLWNLDPALALRLAASNLAPQDSDDLTEIQLADSVLRSRTVSPSATRWQLRLEWKL